MNTRKPKSIPRTSVAQKLIYLTMLCAVIALAMSKCKRDEERRIAAQRIPVYYHSLTFSTDWRETAIKP